MLSEIPNESFSILQEEGTPLYNENIEGLTLFVDNMSQDQKF